MTAQQREPVWGSPCRRGHGADTGRTLRYTRSNGKHGNCVECKKLDRPKRAAEQRARYRDNPEYRETQMARARERARARAATGEVRASVKGMTLAQLHALYAAQERTCATCDYVEPDPSTPSTRLHIDHDHSCCPGQRSCGDCVRGLLCPRCNHALGMAKDCPVTLRKLADYIELAAFDTNDGQVAS